jgi:hypothetical protein
MGGAVLARRAYIRVRFYASRKLCMFRSMRMGEAAARRAWIAEQQQVV